MLDSFNRSLFGLVVAPPDLSGGVFLISFALAEWAIFLVPVVLILLWVLGGLQARRIAIGAFLTTVVALFLASAISSIYFHPRPFMDGLVRNYLHHVVDSSFPSDHATAIFALAWAMLLTPAARYRYLGSSLLLLACAVGWSRVFLGAHYPVDILGGCLLGLGVALAFKRPALVHLRNHATHVAERLYSFPIDVLGRRKR